jgi:hypothetical protein
MSKLQGLRSLAAVVGIAKGHPTRLTPIRRPADTPTRRGGRDQRLSDKRFRWVQLAVNIELGATIDYQIRRQKIKRSEIERGIMAPDVTSSSAGAETAKPEIPIARNSNPAGVSTARPAEMPTQAEHSNPESPESASEAEPGIPIARNSNPAGVSTARNQE